MPNLIDSVPILLDVGPSLVEFVRTQPKFERFRPHVGQIQPGLDEIPETLNGMGLISAGRLPALPIHTQSAKIVDISRGGNLADSPLQRINRHLADIESTRVVV